MTYDGRENLIPFNELTQEEQKALASKGGKASGKARRKKKELKKLLELLLSQKCPDAALGEDNYEGITAALIMKALAGDVKAFEVIRDTIGQKPVETQNINIPSNVNIKIDYGEDNESSS